MIRVNKLKHLGRAILSVLFLGFISQTINAQINSKITGTIVEPETREPIEFVNVGLYQSNDSTLSGTSTSDKNGIFNLSNISAGKYYIEMNCLGFESATISDISIISNAALILDTIFLEVSNILLSDVNVIQKQNTLNTSIDRRVYNVKKDIMSETGSASDILENIPSVTVDVEGNVSLRGSSNITFLVNGKPSSLLRRNSAVALQQIPANTIERIEVITNPSAKYKPDGIGGIINLVLKKERQKGFNGMVIANAGNQERYNLNLSANFNTGKMNLFGSYGFRQNNYLRNSSTSRINRDSTLEVINYYESTSSSTGKPKAHMGNLGFDYQFNEKNKLEMAGNIYFQELKNNPKTLSTWKDKDLTIISEYETRRSNFESEIEWEASAAFVHQFEKEDHELQFELNITAYDEDENSDFNEIYTVPNGRENLSRILIHKGGPQAEFYAEYVLPIGEESELEAGYVGEFFKDNIIYTGENFNNNIWSRDIDKSNEFVFHQNIHALYTTFSHSFDRLSFMAGLRAEQALITSNLTTLDSIVLNNYFRIYPTLHLVYEMENDQELQLNYSHRVNRPDSDEMNPFPEYSDPRNMEAGNPLVKPEQIHSIEFGYQLRKENFTFQPTVYYRYKYDAFAEIQRYVNDTVILRTFENLTQDQSTGMELIATYTAGDFITLNLSSNAFYRKIDASDLGFSAYKSAFSFDTKLGANFNLSKSTLLQLYAYHRSSRITTQGEINPVFYVNMGMRQDLLKNKASLILTVSDVFNSLKSESIIDTPQLYQLRNSTRLSQIIYIGFNYRFGNSAKKQAADLKFDDSI